MRPVNDEINLNWLWRRLDGGGVDGWSLASDGQFDCIVRASDGASWRRHRGLGVWAPVPGETPPPRASSRTPRGGPRKTRTAADPAAAGR
jgi:hypothetical protein